MFRVSIEILRRCFELEEPALIQGCFPNRTWTAIKLKATDLGLSYYRIRKHEAIKSDLSSLLDDGHESSYWAGFLTADGTAVNNRLKLSLSIKDVEHLQAFSNFVKATCRIDGDVCTVAAKDSRLIPQFCEKFGWKPRKTYNPPSCDVFHTMDDDYFLSFLVGFIDGDGCIQRKRKGNASIRLKVHKNWIDVIDYFNYRLVSCFGRRISAKPHIRGSYVDLIWSDHEICKFLRRHVELKQLPALKRKWQVIKLDFVSRMEASRTLRDEVLRNWKLGLSISQISAKLSRSYSTVYGIVRKTG